VIIFSLLVETMLISQLMIF